MSDKDSVTEAAESLAELAETVVVTLGAEGAIALGNGTKTPSWRTGGASRRHDGLGRPLTAATSGPATGAREVEERLQWAVLYANLAVTTPTGIGGAVDEATLLREGAARGLTPRRRPATDGVPGHGVEEMQIRVVDGELEIVAQRDGTPAAERRQNRRAR